MAKRQPSKANETTIKKGEVRNPKGRPKGSQNKRTKEEREAFEIIMELLEKRLTNPDDVINNLSFGRVGDLYATLVNYKKPKLSSTKNENTNEVKGDIKVNISFGDTLNLSAEDEGGEDE